jgi:hypothetical protein
MLPRPGQGYFPVRHRQQETARMPCAAGAAKVPGYARVQVIGKTRPDLGLVT